MKLRNICWIKHENPATKKDYYLAGALPCTATIEKQQELIQGPNINLALSNYTYSVIPIWIGMLWDHYHTINDSLFRGIVTEKDPSRVIYSSSSNIKQLNVIEYQHSCLEEFWEHKEITH